jgi:flavin reductase (DIM6/NTAB) family NADH-FMN oxidoreductase RutF
VAESTDTLISGIDDPAELRRAFTLYPRGVMAVASSVDGEPVGLAVSAFVSVSLDPPLILICIDRESRTWPKLATAGGIGVSVIAEDQAWLGRQLASRRTDRFANATFDTRPSGAMLLEGSVAQLECTVETVHEGGDHIMVMLRVIGMQGDPSKAPLLWHDSTFAGVREVLAPEGR